MQDKKINSVYIIYKSLATLFHNMLIGSKINKEELFYSLFGIIVIDLIINKEEMVVNKEGITYESLMSDTQLEEILLYLNIENIDNNTNGASIYATIRNKLAHGDYYLENEYIIFNINNKECKVILEDFINYYLKLTESLKCRYKGKKYRKNKLVNKSLGKFEELLTTREDILEFLKFLTFKEFILKRNDDKELTSVEKNDFLALLDTIYSTKCKDEKKCDRTLQNIINKKIYTVNINNKKAKKVDEETLNKVEKIVEKNNKLFDYDKEYINSILYLTAEEIYKLLVCDYEHYSIRFGLANLKVILNSMINRNILDFDKFIEEQLKKDELFYFGLPKHEIVLSVILALIYFNYCYPLEKIYKDNKTIEHSINDLDFSKLDFSEINPSINKLYDLGKDNYLNEENIKLNSYKNKYIEFDKLLNNKINQRDNVLKKYKSSKEEKLKKVILNLNKDIENIYSSYEYYLHMYYNQSRVVEELNDLFENKDMNFYNYTIINGIRNSIAHGNISCNNITTCELKDLELEFIDYYDDDIKFKLNINIYNLLSLTEVDNIKLTNSHLVKKLTK